MIKLLLLSSHHACLGQMAEGFVVARGAGDVLLHAAGLDPQPPKPRAVQVMAELGLDISAQPSRGIDAFRHEEFDVVVALSKDAADRCPVLPGHPEHVNWALSDPSDLEGSDEEQLDAFRQVRDEIARLVADLFERGYLRALASAKCYADVVLQNISDGIIAHDMNRRIFYFNKSAEAITGYRQADVIGRDCHEVFPGNFCGGKCVFCDDAVPVLEPIDQEMTIVDKSGEKRLIDMHIKPMQNADGSPIGVLASFRDLTHERRLARHVREVRQFAGIIGRDEKMLEIYDLIGDLTDSLAPVLVQGESGTGKELVAAAIHNEGPRANKLFVPVNCGALPEALLESELFGHVKGAFTGAIRDKKGRFELADGGTIFLDEIGDISPAMQVRLLRVLQEGRFERVGSESTIQVNVRVISATNKDLSEEIDAGRFREDLYYRLSVVPMWLPPLRERRNDIPILVEYILEQRFKREGAEKRVELGQETLDIMLSYDWPGNVRELQNWLQFALIKCKEGSILPEHLPPARTGISLAGLSPRKKRRRRKLDTAAVRSALAETDGNKVEAAKVLGVSRATLYRFLDEAAMV